MGKGNGLSRNRKALNLQNSETIFEIEDSLLDPIPPNFLYHFASLGSQAQISKSGISITQGVEKINPLGNGVYFYEYDPSFMHEKGCGELYKVDARLLRDKLQPDYEIEGAWYYPDPIEAEKVTRIA